MTMNAASLPLTTDHVSIASPKPARERLEWPDVSRGMGIILVVIGHAIGGLITGNEVAVGSPTYDVFYFIYTFHMPMFFFLSGLFIQARVGSDPNGLLARSVSQIAYPYFVWSIIQLTIITMMGSLVNVPVRFGLLMLASVLWWPPSQFWYLYVLFILQVVYRFGLPMIGATGLLILALLTRGVVEVATLPKALDLIFRFGIFFALGVRFGPAAITALKGLNHRYALAAATAVVWLAMAAFSLWIDGNYLAGWAIPAAITGSAMVIVLASVPDLPGSAWLRWIGQRSMPIYLLHVLFVAGTRIALKALFHVTAPGIVLPIAIVIGIVGPLVAYEVAQRLKLRRILALG